jgi:O-acetyl-ADP-ribose deacetylase (regulator of RNase III)
MLTEIKGDLFKTNIKVICHGCNTKGKMFSGIANQFRLKYPDMFLEYKTLCDKKEFNVGDCFWYETNDGKIIANLGTQKYPGPHATLNAITKSFICLFNKCFESGYTEVACCMIGCGIGGLNWQEVKPIIEDLSNQYNINVVVYYL